MSRYNDSKAWILSSTSSNKSIMWKGAECKSRRNYSWLKFFIPRKQILRERDCGVEARKTVYTREWSLICVSTTPDVRILLLLFVRIKLRSVADVFAFRVADLITLCRLKMSNKSKRSRPSYGGMSGFIRSALRSPAKITSLVSAVAASNYAESSYFHCSFSTEGGR